MKIKIAISLLFISQLYCLRGQNFTYSLSKDSSIYTHLVSPIVLSTSGSWKNKKFGLKLPFNFSICQLNSDSLIIENNGFIEFKNTKLLSIISFNNFTSNKDTNNIYSSIISYEVSGSIGNRIVKIQYSNLSQYMLSVYDYLNYQVWLYENGDKIEFHIGSNSYSSNDNSILVSVGLINRNMNFESINGLIINGNSNISQLQPITLENPELGVLLNIPSQGIIYRLTPAYY